MVYLGLDASTQSLTATLIEVDGAERRVVAEESFEYDDALPQYGTSRGVLRGADPLVVGSPPLMWADALDRMMAMLADRHADAMSRLTAVSGSAQQHGSVYLHERAAVVLAELDGSKPLAGQMSGIFSRQVSPVWMDSSTADACREITEAVGGADLLASRTGSRAFERFTGPQIRAFATREPEAYRATARIHLVSSFLASLLAGSDAPIDPGDGSGMNLMDLVTRDWWPDAVEATAPDLARRLPPIAPSWTIAGPLAPYWQHRHRLPPARVVVWSGDNPCSLVGTGLVHEGRVAVSLGTSDTIFGLMSELPFGGPGRPEGHVFASPTGDFMGMTVFKNGSLARERIRNAYAFDWDAFSAALRATPPGNGGALMLPWFDPEITPDVPSPALHRRSLDEANGPANVRAVIEGQMMALANHSAWMGTPASSIHATGGGSVNDEILQVMADVFQADVYRLGSGNSASLGAALRAWHADARASGRPVDWSEVVRDFAVPDPATRVRPRTVHAQLYRELRTRYAAFESEALGSRGRVSPYVGEPGLPVRRPDL
jgi:xylulokinase